MAVRRSIIAGSWYPGNPQKLSATIDDYLEAARIEPLTIKPSALISPHAGYVYSGPVAAHAYKTLQGQRYKTVVVISPSHRAYFPYVAVWDKGCYETPLGKVRIDERLCESLIRSSDLIRAERGPHLQEHALEIQLPFLQHVLGEFELCPLIMGQQDYPLCKLLGQYLAENVADHEDILVVASSDLSHFHGNELARRMDTAVEGRIAGFDVEGLARDLAAGQCEACGGGPIMAAMLYARHIGRHNVRVLKYANSGDVTGDRGSVVGYLAAVLF